MKKLKLNFEGFSQEDLRQHQELFISTISKLKHGLFNAEAALGLSESLTLLGDLHQQTSDKAREIRESLSTINISTDFINEEA